MPLYDKKVKGKKEFLQTLDILKNKEDYFLLVAGRDRNADELYSDIEKSFIERGDYKSLGYIEDQSILVDAYSAADVMIVPSLEETFSYTTAEALSSGTPVVGFEIGGLADMIRNGENGYTVPLGDCVALAKAIELVSDNSVEMGCNARAYAEEYLPLELQGAQHNKLYQKLYQSVKKTEIADIKTTDKKNADKKSFRSVIGTTPFDELQESSLAINEYALVRTLQYHKQELENARKYIYYRFYNALFIKRVGLIFIFVGKKILNKCIVNKTQHSKVIETIAVNKEQDTEENIQEKNANKKISLEQKNKNLTEMVLSIEILENTINEIQGSFGYQFGLSSRREKLLLLFRYFFRMPPKILS